MYPIHPIMSTTSPKLNYTLSALIDGVNVMSEWVVNGTLLVTYGHKSMDRDVLISISFHLETKKRVAQYGAPYIGMLPNFEMNLLVSLVFIVDVLVNS